MGEPNILKEIIAKKKEKILLAKQALPLEELKEKITGLAPTRPFSAAINKPRQICLIAEIKKASPSRGIIRENFSVQEIAAIFQDAGVQAISVLTEEDYFLGSINYLQEAKSLTQVPVLRKDFILEEYQLFESRYYGADAVLLIADLLTQEDIGAFIEICAGLGLECLVEVHDEKELKKVLKIKAVSLVGINNRSLRTFQVDLKTTEKLYPLIPRDKTVVVESGIKTHQDLLFLKILGVNACLIGEAFMAEPEIRRKIEEIMGW